MGGVPPSDDEGRGNRVAFVMPPKPGVSLGDLEEGDTAPPASGGGRRPASPQPAVVAGSSPPDGGERMTVSMRVPAPARQERPAASPPAVETPAFSPPQKAFFAPPQNAVFAPPQNAPAAPAQATPAPLPRPARPAAVPPPPRAVPAGPPPSSDRFRTTSLALRGRDDAEHDLLCLAAVIGERFWYSALRSLVLLASRSATADEWALHRLDDRLNARLLRLKQERVIAMRSPSALPDDLEFAFVDPADRAALLRQMPLSRAEHLHRAVAQWIDQLPAPTRSGWVEVRARHLEQGRRPGMAARGFHEAAGRKAAAGLLAEALALLDRATTLLDLEDAGELADIHMERMRLARVQGDFAEALRAARVSLHASHVLGDPRRGGRALLGTACGLLALEGISASAERHTHAREVLQQAGDEEGLAHGQRLRGQILFARGKKGDVARAIDKLEQAVGPAHGLTGEATVRVRLQTLPLLAEAYLAAGNGRRAERLVRESVQLAEECGGPEARVGADRVAGDLEMARGRADHAQARWERGLEAASDMGLAPEAIRLRVRLARLFGLRGEHERAHDLLRAAVETAEAVHTPMLHAEALIAWAPYDDADPVGVLDRAANLAEDHGAESLLGAVELARAELYAGSRDPSARAAALTAARNAVERFEVAGDRTRLRQALVALAPLTDALESEILLTRARAIEAEL